MLTFNHNKLCALAYFNPIICSYQIYLLPLHPNNPKYNNIMAKTRLRIKELLRERNMTQVDLANKLGVTKITLSQNITRNNWTLAKLEEIAAALECRVIDLFDNSYEISCPHCGHKIEIVLNLKGLSKEQKTED